MLGVMLQSKPRCFGFSLLLIYQSKKISPPEFSSFNQLFWGLTC
jgi:hypothetical protein